MKTPKLIMLDCDGVLVDTEPTTNQALADNLSGYGMTVTAQDCIEMFVGGTLPGVGDIVRAKGITLPETWVEEIYEAVFESLRAGVPTFPGVMAFLDAADQAGIETCVISNGPMAKMEISLGPSGLWDRMAGRIYSCHEHGPAKPDPGMLLSAAKRFGAEPSECIMVDDSVSGLTAGKRAGATTVAFTPDGDPLPKTTFDHHVNGFYALKDLIGI